MIKVCFAEKIGMSEMISETGVVTPVTLLKVVPQGVVRSFEGGTLIGYGLAKKLSKPQAGQFKHLSESYADIVGVSYPPDSINLGVESLSVGDVVSVRAKSKGRGFTGTISRHGFKRGPMSHGSKSHRIPGSIGAGTTPGRVLKGTRMAGRDGGGNITLKNLRVLQLNSETGLVVLSGSVPGKNGCVKIMSGDM